MKDVSTEAEQNRSKKEGSEVTYKRMQVGFFAIIPTVILAQIFVLSVVEYVLIFIFFYFIFSKFNPSKLLNKRLW